MCISLISGQAMQRSAVRTTSMPLSYASTAHRPSTRQYGKAGADHGNVHGVFGHEGSPVESVPNR